MEVEHIRASSLLYRSLQVIILAVIFFFLFRFLYYSWEDVKHIDWVINLQTLTLSSIILLLAFFYAVFIWTRILVKLGYSVPFARACQIWFVSNLGRYIPGKVWQIAGLVVLAREEQIPAIYSSFSVVILNIILILSGFIIGLILLPKEVVLGTSQYNYFFYLPALLMLLCLYPSFLNRIFTWVTGLFKMERMNLKVSFNDILYWFFLIGLLWILHGVAFYFFIVSLVESQHISWISAVGIFSFGYSLGLLAIFVPSGLGIREGAFALMLAGFLTAPVSTGVALASRFWLTVIEFFPATFFLLQRRLSSTKRYKERDRY